ncbi:MAG TPA: cytochrome c peroxidase [Saprospiraceae bacterium]|nr:cytochrome c peroxidase [Saprospiraceae bacterium]HMQ85600.1 cytochrome c peroxidase [Saprospiraceae bacterium]
MKVTLPYISLSCLFFLLLSACQKEDEQPTGKPVLDNTPYVLEYGLLPAPNLPTDNLLTVQGVALGRMLFYETMLSKDGTQSCASCHRQSDGFSDTARFSIGVEGMPGKRQAMPVFNMAWHSNEFFWDGRAHLLRDQALRPIQDPLEMNETLDHVVAKLNNSSRYRDQFVRAFGSDEITPDKMALALEQFMLSIVSFQSKYDRYLAGEAMLTESELRGKLLFETEYNPFFPEFSGADCAHCHGGNNFENDQYMNNGLDSDAELTDLGREMVTQNANDRAKFKVPSLRNIALTAPYMHDGRFSTLEEVIDHYNAGIQLSATVNPTVANTQQTGLFLTNQDKQDLINFLKTLTDDVFLNNEAYQSPF